MTSKPLTLVIDTDVFFASLVQTDAHHHKIPSLYKKLSKEATIYVSDLILAETATLLKRRISKDLANNFLQKFEGESFIVVYQNEKLLRLAKEYFLRQNSKDVTFFDCANMAIAESYQVEAIFSFDKGYERNGFRLLK